MVPCSEHPAIAPGCEGCGGAQWVYFHRECAAFRSGVQSMTSEQRRDGLKAIGYLYVTLPTEAHEAAGCVREGLSQNVVWSYRQVLSAAVDA